MPQTTQSDWLEFPRSLLGNQARGERSLTLSSSHYVFLCKISEAPDAMFRLRRFYPVYCNRVAQIAQMLSGELVPKKSQMASGKSQDTLLESSIRISQTLSAKSAATFLLRKRLMEWTNAALQSESGGR